MPANHRHRQSQSEPATALTWRRLVALAVVRRPVEVLTLSLCLAYLCYCYLSSWRRLPLDMPTAGSNYYGGTIGGLEMNATTAAMATGARFRWTTAGRLVPVDGADQPASSTSAA